MNPKVALTPSFCILRLFYSPAQRTWFAATLPLLMNPCVSGRVFPSSASAGIVSALQVCESTKGQRLHCYDPLDGKGWARAALLSITCLITPPMMKGSRSNLVIAKSLMSLGLRAARAGCECRSSSSRRVSVRFILLYLYGSPFIIKPVGPVLSGMILSFCGGNEGKNSVEPWCF